MIISFWLGYRGNVITSLNCSQFEQFLKKISLATCLHLSYRIAPITCQDFLLNSVQKLFDEICQQIQVSGLVLDDT